MAAAGRHACRRNRRCVAGSSSLLGGGAIAWRDHRRAAKKRARAIQFIRGQAQRQAAADGGFASQANLDKAKARGVSDMAFHKKCGLRIEDMVRSRWVYRKLRNFRAGIEAGISCLKRAYGLARCTWRGLEHFKAYVWSSVVGYNLALFARLATA